MLGKLRQVHTTVAASLGMLTMGILNVWPSYTAVLYTSNTTTLLETPMTQAQESLLGSLPSLGAMVGTVAAGPLLNVIGRRNGGVVISLPMVLSWAIISISSTTIVILAARFLGGVAGGAYLILAPIFISEISEDSIRGALASAPIFLYYMGTVFSYIMGYFLAYKEIIWLNIALGAVNTLLIMLVVESPVYLLKQKREADARLSIAKYRGESISSMIVAEEFSRLKQQIIPSVKLVTTDPDKAEESEQENLNADNIESKKAHRMSPIKLLFLSPASRRAFFMVLTVITMQVLMGIVPVQVYAKTVFTQTDPDRADIYTIVFSLVLLSGAAVTTIVTDKVGRRILLISSSVLVSICMMALGFLINRKDIPALVTVFLILAYCFVFSIGAGTIPYVLLAEVFVSKVQSIASVIIIEWVWLLNFFAIGVFPYMISTIGINGAFFVFACAGAANAVIGCYIVPETKGLSNEEIQKLLVIKRTHRRS